MTTIGPLLTNEVTDIELPELVEGHTRVRYGPWITDLPEDEIEAQLSAIRRKLPPKDWAATVRSIKETLEAALEQDREFSVEEQAEIGADLMLLYCFTLLTRPDDA